jgi:hypothetical protein
MTHTWIGDFRVTLTSPDAEAHTMFYDIGDTNSPAGAGDSSNLSGAYVMRDDATNTLWTGALGGTSSFNIPPGNYRSTNINANVATGINATFGYPGLPLYEQFFGKNAFGRFLDKARAGKSGDESAGSLSNRAPEVANGTWTLTLSDNQAGDIGTLNAGTQLEVVVVTAGPATISGRIRTTGGSPIGQAQVELSGGSLSAPLMVRSNQFGIYQFREVPSGSTYVVSVSSKRYAFANPPRPLLLEESVSDVDFVGSEP